MRSAIPPNAPVASITSMLPELARRARSTPGRKFVTRLWWPRSPGHRPMACHLEAVPQPQPQQSQAGRCAPPGDLMHAWALLRAQHAIVWFLRQPVYINSTLKPSTAGIAAWLPGSWLPKARLICKSLGMYHSRACSHPLAQCDMPTLCMMRHMILSILAGLQVKRMRQGVYRASCRRI